jgi:hypothetical protein
MLAKWPKKWSVSVHNTFDFLKQHLPLYINRCWVKRKRYKRLPSIGEVFTTARALRLQPCLGEWLQPS